MAPGGGGEEDEDKADCAEAEAETADADDGDDSAAGKVDLWQSAKVFLKVDAAVKPNVHISTNL